MPGNAGATDSNIKTWTEWFTLLYAWLAKGLPSHSLRWGTTLALPQDKCSGTVRSWIPQPGAANSGIAGQDRCDRGKEMTAGLILHPTVSEICGGGSAWVSPRFEFELLSNSWRQCRVALGKGRPRRAGKGNYVFIYPRIPSVVRQHRASSWAGTSASPDRPARASLLSTSHVMQRMKFARRGQTCP